MWECSYAKEPLDLKLLLLRLARKLWLLLLAGVLGGGVAGGGYYLGKVILGPKAMYEATTAYYVDYAIDPTTENVYTAINNFTWNTLVKMDTFTNVVLSNLKRDESGGIIGYLEKQELTKEQLVQYLSADLPSDWRMPIGKVATETPELTMNLSEALESAFLKFGSDQKEINEIRVIDRPTQANLVKNDVRTLRAFITGIVLTLFFVGLAIIVYFIIDDSIYIPSTFEYRYGIPMLGTVKSLEIRQNFNYLFREMTSIAVTAVDSEISLFDVKEQMEHILGDSIKEKTFICIPSTEQCPEAVERLRETEGRLLVVRPGARDGKRVEHMVQFMEKQNCKVTAALLWNADERLIRLYYKV